VGSLKRAGFVLFTRCDQAPAESLTQQVNELKARFPALPVGLTRHAAVELIGGDGATASVEELRAKVVVAFCGLGNPEAFRRTLTDLGATVTAFRTFPDHHPYTAEDVDDLTTWAANTPDGTLVVTTQKDWVKLRVGELGERKLWAVRVGLEFLEGEEAFREKLRGVRPDLG
jgi:tetraacyldisaccharide 4'-kinase